MSIKLPKSQQGFADYQGQFLAPAFTLLGTPATLWKNLFEALGKYGARVNDLKVEGQSTGNVTLIVENLIPNNFVVRIRLESLQITFNNLEAIGPEQAKELVLDCWNAIQKTDGSISPTQHTITTAFQFNIPPEEYSKVLSAFTTIPKGLPSQVTTGVAYYLPPGSREGDGGGNIVLDRMVSGALNLRIVMVVNATGVPLSGLGDYVEAYVNSCVGMLGLEVEQQN